MKKILSLILVLAFVLCGVAALNVSADVIINDWTIKRGGGFYIKNSAYEFEWKADNSGKTYEWPAIHNGSFKEGTITATVSPKGGIAIFFGAEGMEGVADGVASVKSATNLRYELVAFEYDSGTPKLKFFYDDKTAGDVTIAADSNMSLADAKYGIDGISDVTISIEFTAAGKVVTYVNGEKVMTRDGDNARPTFGTQFGMMVRPVTYGSEAAGTKVGYVKEFSATAAEVGEAKWSVRRGGNSFVLNPTGAEIAWKYFADSGNANNGRIYTNLIQYYKDLEEGTITASVAKNSRVGIAFGGTGFENVKEGSGNVAVSNAPNFKYYWAVVDWDSSASTYYLALKTDASDADGTSTTIARVNLTDNIEITEYTIKVEFTKDGDIAISYNGEKLIDVTGQTIYGKQLGIIPTNRGPLSGKVGLLAGTINAFEIEEPATEPDNGNQGSGNQGSGNQGSAPDTGDALSVYLAVSAVVLCATFAVALTSRKKIEE